MFKTRANSIDIKETKDIAFLARKFGYKNKEELMDDALRHWILKLQKEEFLALTGTIREKMKAKGITEENLLQDFEEFRYHNK